MTTHKKLLALTIAAVLIISCGCSSQKPNDTQSETNAPSNSTQEVVGENVVTGKIVEVSEDLKTIKIETRNKTQTIEIPDNAEITKEPPPGFDPTQPPPPPPEGEEMPEPGTPEANAEILKVGNLVNVYYDENKNVVKVEMLFHQDANEQNGEAETLIDSNKDLSGKKYSSSSVDKNALRIDNATVTMKDCTVEKTGGDSSSHEASDGYGLNATLLAQNGAVVSIENSEFTSSAVGANGVYSLGDGTIVNIKDSTIVTNSPYSGGIMLSNGGTINATDMNVTTNGLHCPPIRTDKEGGNMTVERGEFTSNGIDSPTIYAMGNVNVSNAKLVSNQSEAIVVEATGNVVISNCNFRCNMAKAGGNSSSENIQAVMIYHSVNATGLPASLTIENSSIECDSGDMFYITNINADLTLSKCTFVNNDPNGLLFRIKGNSGMLGWGPAGDNQGNLILNCFEQELNGDIEVENISQFEMSLNEGSTFSGAIRQTENQVNKRPAMNISVRISPDSTWNLTGDSFVTNLQNDGTINFNGHTITLADGTVLSE